MKVARRQRVGVAAKVAILKSWKGFDMIANRSSMVETFMVCTRRRYHRYWTNTTDNETLNKAESVG